MRFVARPTSRDLARWSMAGLLVLGLVARAGGAVPPGACTEPRPSRLGALATAALPLVGNEAPAEVGVGGAGASLPVWNERHASPSTLPYPQGVRVGSDRGGVFYLRLLTRVRRLDGG